MADRGRHNGKDPLLACDLPIDEPGLLVHHELALTGWAASARGIASVVVRIDGNRELQASYGLDSPWVAEAIPDMPGADTAAYELRLDTSHWAPGNHSVGIVATDRKGHRTEIGGEVEVTPFEEPRYTVEDNLAAIAEGEPVMWLDRPRIVDGVPELSGALEVSGWAYAPDGIESVLVTVDRRARYEALRPISRADLLTDYGPAVAGEAGFTLRLDPLEVPPGPHDVSVVAVARGGRAVGVSGKIVCTAQPAATGPEKPLRIEWLAERRPPRLREQRGGGESRGDGHHVDRLLEAERGLRHRWAAPLAEGRDALDVGPGSEWAADLRNLPFDDASFDLITCFDLVHAAPEPDAALAELQRLLRPGGVVLVSVPRPRVDLPPGEDRSAALRADELEGLARARFRHVAVCRQQTCLSSLLGPEDEGAGELDEGIEVRLHETELARPGEEAHTVVVAGEAPLPDLRRMAVLASAQPIRDAIASALMWEDRALLAEADAAASRTEANLAQMHQKGAVGKLRDAEARALEAEAMEASLSWRITRPLRALKGRLGSLRAEK